MKQPQNDLPEVRVEGQTLSREELVRGIVQEFRQLIDGGDLGSTLDRFNQLHPVDKGEVLVELARGPREEIMTALSPEETADILEQMEPEEAAEVAARTEASALAEILDATSLNVAADILQQLSAEDSRETLEAMEAAEEVRSLLQYPEDTAGGLMTVDYPVVRNTTSTPNALDQLRLLGLDAENLSSILVVDKENRLEGSLSITRLALARPSALVGELIDHEIISVGVDTDQEECARLMERYNLSRLPVVDRDGRLEGVILVEDIVGVVEKEATEDMYRMAGVAGERLMGPLRNSLRRRLPWLYVNLATAFLAASTISIFESTISKVVALAVFLPVVAGQGGIGGTQTVTLVIRSMALGEVPRRLGLRLLARELSLGLIHGALLGVVVGLVAYGWKGNFTLGVVLGVAMLGNMVVASLAGAGVPLMLRRLRMDPALSSAVFVTTFTDVLGFLLFLGLASAFVNSLT